MTRHASIAFSDQDASFIDRQVENGTFRSVEDVVSAGLRLLEEHEAKVKALQYALAEGEKGPFTLFDPDAFLEEIHRKRLPE